MQADLADPDARHVQRQAFAGLIWNRQFYRYDIPEWLQGDPAYPPPPPEHVHGRNSDWTHLDNAEILSMPDKWEYPYYCAWDSAFHCLTFALIDPEFAKQQLVLLLREWYMHPNGQVPAYEWNFSDVNPPVHAWAAWRIYLIDRKRGGQADLVFLERVYHKLLLNFTWWVNRKDVAGRNIFQGGFLGLDNIGVFDRSAPLPEGVRLDQADATSWMAMFSLNMLRIALELARHNHVYEDIATKFFEHFLGIALAMTNIAREGIGLWDEEDEFYYDVLDLSDGRRLVQRLRSIVGLIPLFAVETLEPETLNQLPDFKRRLHWVLHNRGELAQLVSRWEEPGRGHLRLLSLLRGHRIKCLLRRMLDETEFLSALRRALPVALSPRAPVHVRLLRAPFRGGLLAGRVGFQHVRRQLQLARPDLDADQLSADRVAAAVSPLLWRRLQGGVSHGFGPLGHSSRGGRGIDAPVDPAVSARRARPPPGAWRVGEGAARSSFPRPYLVFGVFPRRRRPRPRQLAPDRLDRARRQAAATARGVALTPSFSKPSVTDQPHLPQRRCRGHEPTREAHRRDHPRSTAMSLAGRKSVP